MTFDREMVMAFIALGQNEGLETILVFNNVPPERRKLVLEIELLFRDTMERFGPRFPARFQQPATTSEPSSHLRNENQRVDQFEDAKEKLTTALMRIGESEEAFGIVPAAGHPQLRRLQELVRQIPRAA